MSLGGHTQDDHTTSQDDCKGPGRSGERLCIDFLTPLEKIKKGDGWSRGKVTILQIPEKHPK